MTGLDSKLLGQYWSVRTGANLVKTTTMMLIFFKYCDSLLADKEFPSLYVTRSFIAM
jgi:hypothetical protein